MTDQLDTDLLRHVQERDTDTDEALLSSSIPYSHRELIQRAIVAVKPAPGDPPTPRWALVKALFSTSDRAAKLICWNFGFDPEHLICGE